VESLESLRALIAGLVGLREASARWAVVSGEASRWIDADDTASAELEAARWELEAAREAARARAARRRARARLH
jgi:hypothetical protein